METNLEAEQTVDYSYPDPERSRKAMADLVGLVIKMEGIDKSGKPKILDIGSGEKGSDFVLEFKSRVPGADVHYLDKMGDFLKEMPPAQKHQADAQHLPLPDEAFRIAYSSGVIGEGVVTDVPWSGDRSFRIAQEAYRVLAKGGVFIFTYSDSTDLDQSINNLSKIGFKKFHNLQKRITARSSFVGTLMVKK